MSATKPVCMFKGSGSSAVTQYSCGAVEQAKADGLNLTIVRHTKSGRMGQVNVKPRMVHRPDLLGTFGETHEFAGQGKYIDEAAFSQGRKRVVGAQHVNPYLREEGVYASIVEAFKHNIGLRVLSKLRATVAKNFNDGIHLLWEGRNSVAEAQVAASGWMTAEQLWELAREINPELMNVLRKSRSGRTSDGHKPAKDKFFGDLNVLRRATRVIDVGTGKRTFRGGATPCSKPLEQVGFAIDRRYLTYGVDSSGNELAQYYYRMVIGRSEPHSLKRSSWVYEGTDSEVAFLNVPARRQVIAATRKNATAA